MRFLIVFLFVLVSSASAQTSQAAEVARDIGLPAPTTSAEHSLELPGFTIGKKVLLPLKQAICIVLNQNYDLQIEKINTGISKTNIQKERADFDPQAKLETTQTHSNAVDAAGTSTITDSNKSAGELSCKLFSGTTLALIYDNTDKHAESSDGRYQSNLKLSLTQDLLKNFGIGINRAKIRIAKKEFKQTQATYHQKVVDTIADMQTAYWELYKSSKLLEIRKQSYGLSDSLLRQKRVEAKLGTIATVELVEIESDVASRITDYADAVKQMRTTEVKLRALLALPMEFGAEAAYFMPTTRPRLKPLKKEYDQVIASVLKKHQGYQSLVLEREAKVIEVAYHRNQLLPSLQLKANYGLQNNSNDWRRSAAIRDGGDNFELGLSITVPFGNNSARAARTKSELELEKIDTRLKKKESEIRKEINIALIAVEQAATLVRASRTNVAIKKKNLDAFKKKLKLGTGNLRSLLDRQTDLVDAQLKQTEYEVDYQTALIAFYKAQGIIDPDLNISISDENR